MYIISCTLICLETPQTPRRGHIKTYFRSFTFTFSLKRPSNFSDKPYTNLFSLNLHLLITQDTLYTNFPIFHRHPNPVFQYNGAHAFFLNPTVLHITRWTPNPNLSFTCTRSLVSPHKTRNLNQLIHFSHNLL